MPTGAKPDVVVEELVAARASLVERRAANLDRLLDAKSALRIATKSQLARDAVCFVEADGSPLTVSQMADFIARLEAEDAKSFDVLGAIDAQLALALNSVPTRLH